MAKQQHRATKTKLLISVILDLIGMGSILISFIPFVGPFIAGISDLFFGPITAIYIRLAFTKHSTLLAWVGLGEEWLPGTDILPTCTIAWLVERFA